nr:immunoglobulin heavy chain junction region [Mus musculus]
CARVFYGYDDEYIDYW